MSVSVPQPSLRMTSVKTSNFLIEPPPFVRTAHSLEGLQKGSPGEGQLGEKEASSRALLHTAALEVLGPVVRRWPARGSRPAQVHRLLENYRAQPRIRALFQPRGSNWGRGNASYFTHTVVVTTAGTETLGIPPTLICTLLKWTPEAKFTFRFWWGTGGQW